VSQRIGLGTVRERIRTRLREEPVAQLIRQFERACSNVEPEEDDVDNAASAHEEVRKPLEADPELSAVGIDTILIGSYKRHVSIRRVKDVDVFSKTDDLDMTATDALDLCERVLIDAFGEDRVERQDRSIKVLFPDFDLHVDVVPARPCGEYWEIPDRDGEWEETNPEKLTELATELNDRYDDRYVPIVKLVRQTRRQNLGKRPGGFFFEILTYHAFDDGLDGDNIGELYVAALRSIADQLDDFVDGGDVDDPTMDEAVISIRATESQKQKAADTLAELATKAEDALADEDKCRAAKAFRDILGKNSDDEWVFPMPAGCNDDGTARALTTAVAGDRHVPAGNRRFA
jgi:hypothetical protein